MRIGKIKLLLPQQFCSFGVRSCFMTFHPVVSTTKLAAKIYAVSLTRFA